MNQHLCVQQAEEAWERDALERVAALARAALPSALPPLKAALQAQIAPIAAGSAPSVATLEQLWWFVRLAACVLADAGKCETPMVPVEVLELCEQQGAGMVDALEVGALICQVCSLP
jgi:hypothetical protein